MAAHNLRMMSLWWLSGLSSDTSADLEGIPSRLKKETSSYVMILSISGSFFWGRKDFFRITNDDRGCDLWSSGIPSSPTMSGSSISVPRFTQQVPKPLEALPASNSPPLKKKRGLSLFFYKKNLQFNLGKVSRNIRKNINLASQPLIDGSSV